VTGFNCMCDDNKWQMLVGGHDIADVYIVVLHPAYFLCITWQLCCCA